MEAQDWNIVVLAHWNRAILTPNWIASKMFQLPTGTNMDVLVSLDGIAPFQVRHSNLTIVPGIGQLLVQLDSPTTDTLAAGLEAAKRAIGSLPHTPFKACGINIRYSADEPPEALLVATRCRSEAILSGHGEELRALRRGESIKFGNGRLNIAIDIPMASQCQVAFNFERRSDKDTELTEWLSQDAAAITAKAANTLQLLLENNDAN